MAEYNEDDLAKEMEELKKAEEAKQDGSGSGGAGAPKRRGPPRRKTGSSNLTAFGGAAAGLTDEGIGED